MKILIEKISCNMKRRYTFIQVKIYINENKFKNSKIINRHQMYIFNVFYYISASKDLLKKHVKNLLPWIKVTFCKMIYI